MSIALATHLKVSRHGIFYFRMTVPASLRTHFGKRELLYSLHTRDPAKAKRLAYTLTSQTHILFGKMAYDPSKFNPFDVSTFPTSGDAGGLRPYELDLQRGIMKSDGEDDHRRMLEAVAIYKSMPQQQIQAPPPVQYVEPQPAHTIKLSKALDVWLPTLSNMDTRKGYETYVKDFIATRGDIDIHQIRKVDVVTWNNKLLKSVCARTADNRIQALQSLLKWGKKNEYIHENTPVPTEGKFNLTKTERNKVTNGAQPFSVEELNKIFEPVAYEKYSKHYGVRFDSSRYWIPLIALYTGMRKEEIAQLTTVEIRSAGDIDYFEISTRERESLKNETATRIIPIHPKLIELGFMDFVRTKSGRLFEERRVEHIGDAVSKRFVDHLIKVGVRKPEVKREDVLHSFRDTFNNTLVDANVPDDIIYALMGHKNGDANHTSYRKSISVRRLKGDGMDKLDFQEIVGGHKYTLIPDIGKISVRKK